MDRLRRIGNAITSNVAPTWYIVTAQIEPTKKEKIWVIAIAVLIFIGLSYAMLTA